MSEYYSALLHAIGNLDEAGAQSRRSLYERAQAALLAQMVSRSPRPTPAQIDEENRLLADAIRRLEAEFGRMIGKDGLARSRDILLKVLAGKKPTAPLTGTYSRKGDHLVSELIELL